MNHTQNTIEEKNTRVQLYWKTLLSIPAQIFSFIVSILIARVLMPRDFGIMGIVMMLIGYINMITNLGFSEAIIQKGIHDKRVLNSIFTFNILTSSILAGGFYIGAGLIADFFHTPECKMVIRVMSLMFIITTFPVIPISILRRDMDFKSWALISLVQSILMSAITLFLAYKGLGYWSLAYGQMIPAILISLFLCLRVKYLPRLYYNHSLMGQIYNFGFWNFANQQLSFISTHVDKFVIGKWMGPVLLGYYDKAMGLAMAPNNSITMNINSVMFSSFSLNKANRRELQESFKKGIALVALITFPIHFGLIVIAPYFVDCLLGRKWSPMILPFQIILSGLVIKSLGGMIASLNVAIGKYKENTIRFFYTLLIFVFLCIVFLNSGIIAIAISFTIFSIIEILLLLSLSLKSIELHWLELLKDIRSTLIASIIMFLITLGISYFILPEHSILNMVFIVFAGALVYLAYLYLDRSAMMMEIKHHIKEDFLIRLLEKH